VSGVLNRQLVGSDAAHSSTFSTIWYASTESLLNMSDFLAAPNSIPKLPKDLRPPTA
jgi:hypothetical protein